jgi:NAD+ synthase
MNTEKVCDQIINWILSMVKESGKNGIVLGISGGIDSAVVCKLSMLALGKENVHGMMLPYYSDYHYSDAVNLVNKFGISHSTIWINKIYQAIYETGLLWGDKTKENTMSRIRMVLLRAYANDNNVLLAGTGNASEYFTGYFTKGGDSEADIFPIIQLTKGQVYEIAKLDKVSIPDTIIRKIPSAGLAPGQSDENDLGLTYQELDQLVLQYKYGTPTKNVSENSEQIFDNLRRLSEHKRSNIKHPNISDVDLFI